MCHWDDSKGRQQAAGQMQVGTGGTGDGECWKRSRKEKENPKVFSRTVGEWISHGSVPDPGFESHTMGIK